MKQRGFNPTLDKFLPPRKSQGKGIKREETENKMENLAENITYFLTFGTFCPLDGRGKKSVLIMARKSEIITMFRVLYVKSLSSGLPGAGSATAAAAGCVHQLLLLLLVNLLEHR